ncbi:unnamed protein product [Heligmosomoides polygyrus]|uniref:PMEI domain-containing protein n=1 Tax=Heligmosomoides polygyrus TaxID=6339 RepID=A0A183GMT9_HELPZ|nr:unnamed protein product [Heligmosomoides polygyrus]
MTDGRMELEEDPILDDEIREAVENMREDLEKTRREHDSDDEDNIDWTSVCASLSATLDPDERSSTIHGGSGAVLRSPADRGHVQYQCLDDCFSSSKLGNIEGISFPGALAKKPIVDVWSAWKTASIFVRNDKDLPTKMKMYREHAVVLDVDALSKVLKVAYDTCMEWTDFICSTTGVTRHAPVDSYAVERFCDTALRKVKDVIAGSAKRSRPTKEGPVGFAAPDCARMLEVDGGKIGIRAKVVVTFQQLKEQVDTVAIVRNTS